MARSYGLLLAAAALHSVHAHDEGFHVDASGAAIPTNRQRISEDPSDFVEILRRAKESLDRTHQTEKMIRTEVRRHIPEAMENAAGIHSHDLRAHIDEAFALLATGEVNCSAMASNPEPVTAQLCRILVGNNTQVSGKLERAVKGLSLRPKGPNATEMIVADKVEDSLLSHLRAALWDMWFCAKRVDPPCDPMTSQDKRVKAAREQAFDSLHAIHTHSEESSGASTNTAAAAAQPSRREVDPHNVVRVSSEEAALIQTSEKATFIKASPVVPASQWASNVMNNMLTPPGVTTKLYEAINDLDVDTNLQTDIVRIEKDEDGMMKKLKADLLLLHECASMPDCAMPPQAGCCTPKNPTQAIYIQARNDAYVAYHNMEHDNDMAKTAYVDLLKNIAGPTTTKVMMGASASGGIKKKKRKAKTTTAAPDASTQDAEVDAGPSKGASGNETGNSTDAKATSPTDEGGDSTMLIIGISAVGVIVLLAVGFLAYKMQSDGKGKADTSYAEESWEGEGEEHWGNY